MSNTTTIRLWFIRQTKLARLYSKTPPGQLQREVWIPMSIIEHTTKRCEEHMVKLPDWFVEKEGL